MLIGVVSDTHGHISNTLKAIRVLETFDVQTVIHCGDIGSAAIVELFSSWPTHFVWGNVDQDTTALSDVIESGGHQCHNRFGSLELAEKKIAFLHSDDDRRFRETISSQKWDLVCHGHTHLADQRQQGRTLVLNPGAIYRATPLSLAVVELPSLKVITITL